MHKRGGRKKEIGNRWYRHREERSDPEYKCNMTGLLRRLAMTDKKYLQHYPEEYITGKVTFFGREFIVTPDVLIPRLETESLVRRAREVQKAERFNSIVDIGCGSGNIGTSLADLAPEIIFLDISPDALAIAERNFRVHFPQKKAEFIVSDLLSKLPLQGESREDGRDFFPETKSPAFQAPSLQRGLNILFLANLPYIKG